MMTETNMEITRAGVLKNLKKVIGEKAAQEVCNANLWTVPNIEHVLEFAGRNVGHIKGLFPIIREIYKEKVEPLSTTDEDPLTLLDKAGYVAWYVEDEATQNSIAGYFRDQRSVEHEMTGGNSRTNKGELICTIYTNWDDGAKRFASYYIINAVKKKAFGDDKLSEKEWHIKPSDTPEREDEYGTSVISIQILKTGGFISIKNRYNHTIHDPDNTFNSNPDEIIPGLSYSLQKHFNVSFNVTRARMPSMFRMINDQFVHYNYEINNTYFDSDYYFSGSTITKINNDNQILFYRGFLLTMKKGDTRIESITGKYMELCNELNKFMHGKKVTSTKNKQDGTKTIFVDDERFMDVKNGLITFIHAPNFKTINFDSRGIKLSGDLDFSGVKDLDLSHANLSEVTNIKFNPNADKILLKECKLFGDLDFSGVQNLDLTDADLTKVTSMKFNLNANEIFLKGCKLSGVLDFSSIKKLDLMGADLTKVIKIKFNPNAESINLVRAKLSGDLDFSMVKNLDLQEADLTKVTNIKFNPSAESINLACAKLSGDLDFSMVKKLDLQDADLTKVTNIKFNPSAESINLARVKLSGDLDFSMVKKLNLQEADLTKVTNIKFNPSAESIVLIDPKKAFARLSGELDFSGVGTLIFDNVNLQNVTNIKFNPNAYRISIKITNYYWEPTPVKLSGVLDFSNVKRLELGRADLSDVSEIKLNPKAEEIELPSSAKLSGNVDFSGVKNLTLFSVDLTKTTNIKFDPTGQQKVMISGAKMAGNLTFRDYTKLDLNGVNLTKATSAKFSKITELILTRADMSGKLDFNSVKKLDLSRADMTKVTSVDFVNVYAINFQYAKLGGVLNFHSVKYVSFAETNLTEVKSINFNMPVQKLYLNQAKLAGDLDFTKVQTIVLDNETNVTKVTSIKMTQELYNQIKTEKCRIGNKIVSVQNLHKYGIKVRISGRFAAVTRNLKQAILDKILHKNNQPDNENNR